MARRKQNPINDIKDAVGAWLGGNRGSVPSSGAGAAWQASARSAAQSANQRIVKGLEEVPVQMGALGMGTSAQTQRDLMYGVSGAGTRAAKEASVSQVTGLAAGAVAAKAAQVAGRALAKTGIPARVANKVRGEVVLIHGSPTQGIKTINPTKGPNRGRGTRGVDLGLQGFYGVPSRNPQFGPSQVATKYALGDQEKNLAQNVVGQGSVYLAKAKKADLIFEQGGNVARTSKSARVVKELRLTDYPREASQSLIDDYVAALKKAGGPTVPRGVRKQSRGGGRNKK